MDFLPNGIATNNILLPQAHAIEYILPLPHEKSKRKMFYHAFFPLLLFYIYLCSKCALTQQAQQTYQRFVVAFLHQI